MARVEHLEFFIDSLLHHLLTVSQFFMVFHKESLSSIDS